MRRLTRAGIRRAAAELAAADPAMAASLERHGPPPLWAREPSFATLVHLILEQQVSLASAQAGTLPDEEVRARLTALRGVGRWTADIYLLMCLRRPDVWPHGDLALATAAMEVLGLAERPTYESLNAMAERWRPNRATAARILWHDYLRSRDPPT